jgi:hypothetical protein
MDAEMIFIVVLADVMEMADCDLRARFDIWHPGSAHCHFGPIGSLPARRT